MSPKKAAKRFATHVALVHAEAGQNPSLRTSALTADLATVSAGGSDISLR
jgi:hypothetical protein